MGLGWGMAAQPDLPGHVFFADYTNQRVSVFDAWGTFLYAFGWKVNAANPEEAADLHHRNRCRGSRGAGAGQFEEPEALAIGPEGDVYVAEAHNYRIQKFTPSGELVLTFGYKVNKSAEEEARSAEEDVCPAPGHPADVCRPAPRAPAPGSSGGMSSSGLSRSARPTAPSSSPKANGSRPSNRAAPSRKKSPCPSGAPRSPPTAKATSTSASPKASPGKFESSNRAGPAPNSSAPPSPTPKARWGRWRSTPRGTSSRSARKSSATSMQNTRRR